MEKKRIFIAEDFPMQIELLRAIMEKEENYQTSFFSDGLEIYQRVQDDPPDLLVLDIILPSLSGLAITRLLKFHDSYKDIPVLVTSSITDPSIKENALKAGADVFLPKPFQATELLGHIATLLQTKGKRYR